MFSYGLSKDEKQLTPNKIIDNLYLGNCTDSEKKQALLNLGVKYILIAGNHLRPNFPQDFKYLQIPIDDHQDEDITQYFQQTIEYYNFLKNSFIKEGINSGGCLVHCAAGISRSTSFVIAFLMKEKMWTLNQAYKHVLECRSVVYPNYGFQIQLKRLEIFLGFMTEEECEKEIEKNKFNLINFD